MSIAPGQSTATGSPAAGWYADPAGDGQRWWDGIQWTEHVMPASTPEPARDAASAQAVVASPDPVTSAASWIPAQANPLDPGTGFEGYAVTPSAGPHRGPSGYVAHVEPSSYASTSPYGSTTTIDSRAPYGAAVHQPVTFATPAGPAAYAAPAAAPAFPYSYLPGVAAPKNTAATVGFVLGVAFVAVGVLFGYWFGSLLAVVVSISGLTRSRKLAAQGYPPAGRSLAIWGIVLSVLSWAVAVGLRLAGFGI